MMDNVLLVLNKYKNQRTSRRNFDPELHLFVYDKIMKLYPTNKDLIVEIYMNLIATFFESAKNQINGYLIRQAWLDTNAKITELLGELETKNFSSMAK